MHDAREGLRLSETFAAVRRFTALDFTRRAELHEQRREGRQQWKRDLSGRANGMLDQFSGCFLLDELFDYAVHSRSLGVRTLLSRLLRL